MTVRVALFLAALTAGSLVILAFIAWQMLKEVMHAAEALCSIAKRLEKDASRERHPSARLAPAPASWAAPRSGGGSG